MALGLLVMIWTATVFAQNGCNSNRTAETHSNLVLSSPNYPQDYDNNMDCLWRIQTNPFSGPDYIIKVTFQDFELEDPHSLFSCQYDSLKFYDGPLPLESTLLGSYCGTVRPDVIYSQGKYLYVKFHSDSTTTYKGFELYYTAVKREEALGICRPPYLDSVVSSLNGSSGTFFSPDFPVPYPANATCTWTITVPEGKGVMLTFEDFALRKHSVTSDCHDDWRDFVEIRDSLSSTGKQLGRFNCDLNAPDLPLKVYSTGRYMFVKFHSSFSTSFRREADKGFKAKFEAANQPSTRCNFNRTAETHVNLVLSSPNYPQDYDNNMDCLWRIQTNPFSTGPDYIVKVTFQDFELENPHNLYFCQYDSLKFYDGTLPQESTVLGSYCGTVRPDVIYSRGKYLYVKFQSDSTTTYKGFELYYTAVKKEEALGICRPPYLDSVVSSLNGSSGTFFSPGYPVPYPASATCTWTITVPEGKRVMLTFEDFALRKHSVTSDCHGDWKDFVEIRDSLSSTGKQLGRFNCDLNAPDLPPKVYSNGRYMFVKFHSSFGTPFRREGDKGFKAKFEAVNQPSTHVDSSGLCSPGNRNKILRLTGSSGTLKVPPKYPEGLRCTWLINVPEGNDVKLSFTKFDLNWHGGTCGDNVEILDGQYTSSERLEKYCAYADPSPKGVASNGRYMMVIFRADFRSNFWGSNQREGIEANFRAVKKSNSTLMRIGVTVGAVILIIIIGLCCVCHAKKKRLLNRETRAARIPMTTTTTTASASHTIHPPPPAPEAPVANPYPTPEVGSAPVPTEPPPPYYPYPLESPPPYPGLEGGLQYPPPGESYPWSQSTAPTQPGAPPTYL